MKRSWNDCGPNGDRDRAESLLSAEAAGGPGADVVADLEVFLLGADHLLHRGRGELQRLVHAGEAIDLDLVIDVDHLADGAESRGVHEDGIARLDAGLAVGGLELDHRVLHLQAADFAAVAGGHGRSEVAAVAEVFVGRPGAGDPRRRPGTGRRVGHGDALFHARRTRRRGRGGRGRLAGEGPRGRVA